MKRNFLMAVAALVLANPAFAQKLGTGLTWPQFQKQFSSHADWDQETSVRLKNCDLRQIPNKPLQSFGCDISSAGMISGITAVKGPMQDVAITFLESRQAIYDFQRAAKYLIYATQGGRTDGALSMVVKLMGMAQKSPDKGQSETIQGIRYTATFEPTSGSGPKWHFWAEKP